jgi:hypothetical protein
MTRRETTTKRPMTTAGAPVEREHAEPPRPGSRRVLLHGVGLGLLLAAWAIQLDLYLTGYRTIPAISRLFLLQVISALGVGLAAPCRHGIDGWVAGRSSGSALTASPISSRRMRTASKISRRRVAALQVGAEVPGPCAGRGLL